MSDPLIIAGRQFGSRLFLGTAGYPNRQVLLDAPRWRTTTRALVQVRGSRGVVRIQGVEGEGLWWSSAEGEPGLAGEAGDDGGPVRDVLELALHDGGQLIYGAGGEVAGPF